MIHIQAIGCFLSCLEQESLDQMKEYRKQAKILRALAHPMRLQILDALARGPACVCELITVTGGRPTCISQCQAHGIQEIHDLCLVFALKSLK